MQQFVQQKSQEHLTKWWVCISLKHHHHALDHLKNKHNLVHVFVAAAPAYKIIFNLCSTDA